MSLRHVMPPREDGVIRYAAIKNKYTHTNKQIQIHKYKYTHTNTQIQIHNLDNVSAPCEAS